MLDTVPTVILVALLYLLFVALHAVLPAPLNPHKRNPRYRPWPE